MRAQGMLFPEPTPPAETRRCTCGRDVSISHVAEGAVAYCPACSRPVALGCVCYRCRHHVYVWLWDAGEFECSRCHKGIFWGERWLGERVVWHGGDFEKVSAQIPRFRRYPFAFDLPSLAVKGSADEAASNSSNRYFDTIVREPLFPGEPPIPVGMVSRKYNLIQHHDVVSRVRESLCGEKIDPDKLMCTVKLTEYGSRMRLRIDLPANHDFPVAVGDTMKLSVECLNSVDGSVALQVMLTWYRLVCLNGMIVGTTLARSRQIHTESLSLGEISSALADGLAAANKDKRIFKNWMTRKISRSVLTDWVDHKVNKQWGVSAAARVYHIALTGYDAELIPGRGAPPPSVRMLRRLDEVPGISAPASDLFQISQVLSWIARGRNDLGERQQWMADIAGLMRSLSRN